MFQPHLIFLIVTAVFLSGERSHAEIFRGTKYGYSITIPSNWMVIPAEKVREAAELLYDHKGSQKIKVITDAAFQSAQSAEWFEYPYVIVQVIPYGNYGINRQINEDEFNLFIKSMTGVDAAKTIDAALPTELRELVSDFNFEKPHIDKTRRRFFVPFMTNITGVGKVRGLTVGYFGRECIVQVNFYAAEGNWDQHISVGTSIIDSFRFDLAKEYVAAAALKPVNRSIWSGVGEKAIVGGIIGVLLMIFFTVSRLLKSKPHAPGNNN